MCGLLNESFGFGSCAGRLTLCEHERVSEKTKTAPISPTPTSPHLSNTTHQLQQHTSMSSPTGSFEVGDKGALSNLSARCGAPALAQADPAASSHLPHPSSRLQSRSTARPLPSGASPWSARSRARRRSTGCVWACFRSALGWGAGPLPRAMGSAWLTFLPFLSPFLHSAAQQDEIKDNEGKVIMGGFDGEGYRIKDRQGKEKGTSFLSVLSISLFSRLPWQYETDSPSDGTAFVIYSVRGALRDRQGSFQGRGGAVPFPSLPFPSPPTPFLT